MAYERFFASVDLATSKPGREIFLNEEESRHLRDVFRISSGDTVVVFDGNGFESQGVVQTLTCKVVSVLIETPIYRPREAEVPLELCVALPGGGGADDVLRRAMECGVRTIVPLITRRSVFKPERRTPAEAAERFRRLALSVMKQSGRNLMPVCEASRRLEDLPDDGRLVLVGGPAAEQTLFEVLTLVKPPLAGIRMIIGPEGGLDPEEQEYLRRRGAREVSLGPQILRVEIATVAALSFLASLRRP